MVEKSIWSISASSAKRSPLQSDIETDTVIIGGGMAGILTAHFLEQAGMKCVVLEADRIGSGQTKNTTAKVTSQHGMIYDRLLQNEGIEKAGLYAAANQEAVERYRILAEKYQGDIGWNQCPAYLYTMQDTGALRREHEAAKRIGLGMQLTEKTELPFQVKLALKLEGQGQFHPLRFLYMLAEELTIFEHTKVTHVEDHTVLTAHGTVHAQRVVFACHYPFLNSPGYYFMRMHQERSYVLAVKKAASMEGMYYGIDEDGLSFRSAGENLLIGGGGHRTGKNTAGNSYEYLSSRAEALWPECKETARCSAQDCMTLDGIPYIGKYSKSQPDWYVATGFGKWGMTSSMVSAMILSDLICGRQNQYADVFTPRRFHLQSSVGTLIKEGGYAVSGLMKQLAAIPKEKLQDLRPGHGGIVEHDGNKYGVYREETGKLFAISTRCPHLGCQLAWNPDEKSWDCPCHGSRFDYRGKRLDGPAQNDLECHIRKGN